MNLDERIKELVAVGASITANCQPCLQFHTSKARACGASEREIAEAIEVGKAVRKGAAAKMDKFIDSINQGVPVGAASEADVCGCGCGS